MTAAYLFIILIAILGLGVAWYIRMKKNVPHGMVCPLQSDCDAVVHSQFSVFFGIPIEILGMLYYGVIILAYAVITAFPVIASELVVFLLLVMSLVALLFSAYLTFIQAFAIKEWCTWCLTSAGFCTVIFFSSLFATEFGFVDLLATQKGLLVIVHLIGVALGVGGATITDILFFKFLKDFRISHEENDILHTVSQVIWFALALLIVSGIGLYLPEASALNQTPKFLAKVFAILIIILNGAFLNLIVSPKLVRISFGQKHEHQTGELKKLRKLAFALGAVSITSWYSALILATLPRSLPFNASDLILIYLGIVLLGVVGSQIMDYFIRSSDANKAQ